MPFVYRRGLPLCRGPAVYLILNKATGKIYVGSSITAFRRLTTHRAELRRGTHANGYLQKAWNKWGEQSFRFSIIETCSVENLLATEQKRIDELDACNRSVGYNLCPIAGGSRVGRKYSEESRLKMSESTKGQDLTLQVMRAAEVNRGRKRPPEVRRKISEAQKGRPKTQAQREKTKMTHWSKRPDAAEIVERVAVFNRGKKQTPEHVAKRFAHKRAGIVHGTTS